MSPWLFNNYMHQVVREDYGRMQGRGVMMIGQAQRECLLSHLLFALLAESVEQLQCLVREFEDYASQGI